MAKLTIDIPDNVVQTVLNSFATVYGLPDGVTKAQNAKEHIRQYIKDIHRQAGVTTVEAQDKVTLEQNRNSALTQAETEAGTITVS